MSYTYHCHNFYRIYNFLLPVSPQVGQNTALCKNFTVQFNRLAHLSKSYIAISSQHLRFFATPVSPPGHLLLRDPCVAQQRNGSLCCAVKIGCCVVKIGFCVVRVVGRSENWLLCRESYGPQLQLAILP